MAIKVKKGGVYADPVGIFAKKAGVYSAVTGVSAKVAGAYLSATDAIPAWDGSTYFAAGKGINEAALGFDQFNAWSGNPNLWPNRMTSGRWASILGQTTFDHIRIPVDPTPLLRATANPATTATYIAMIKGAVDDVMARGLKAIVDMHVSATDPEYSDALLCAGYPGGATWPKMQQVWTAVAKLLNQYPTDKVAFEFYNESFSDQTKYLPMVKALVPIVRAQAGFKTTFLIGPYNGSYASSASPSFVAADFGLNTGFVFHMYTPGVFTHQALLGSSYDKYINSLGFPAVEGNRSAAIASATANVNADSGLTAPQKTAMIDLCTFNLNYFFDTFVEGTDYDGTQTVPAIGPFFQEFGSLNPSTLGAGSGLEAWRVANGIPGSRIFVTEFGAHQKYESDGANKADFLAWLGFVTRYMNVRNLSRTVWNDDDRHFSIRKDTDPGAGYEPNGDFDPDILTAIGAYKPSTTWLPTSEAAGTFTLWLDGADRASYTSSGGFVSNWADKSGAGNHATQATGSAQPSDLTDGIGITTTRFFETALPANSDTESIFMVVNMPSVAGSLTLLGPASAGGKRAFRITSGNLNLLRAGVAQEAATSGAPVPAAAKCLLECQLVLGSQTIMGVNGTLQTATGNHSTTFGAASASRIGTKDDGGEDGVGTYHEIIVMPTRPSTLLATQIRFYLKNKWGIA